MLDEKGRLFGKVNIVDLLIVLVVIAAIAFVGIKYVMPKAEAPAGEKIELVVSASDSKNFVIDELKAGSPVWNQSGNVNIGTVKSWTSKAYVSPIAGAEGIEIIQYEEPDRSTVDIVIECEGSIGDFGATVNGELYGMGHTMVIYCGGSKFYVAVKSFKYI